MRERTDLHSAAFEGDIETMRKLLAQQPDLNSFDDTAFTPLHYAADQEHLEIVRLLIDAGADVNAHDESQIGNNPIGEIAGKCSLKMASILIEAGSDPTIRGWMQLSALDRAAERTDEEGQLVYNLLLTAAEQLKAD